MMALAWPGHSGLPVAAQCYTGFLMTPSATPPPALPQGQLLFTQVGITTILPGARYQQVLKVAENENQGLKIGGLPLPPLALAGPELVL